MKNQKGFTLIEIIAVIVILSIILMIGTYALNGHLIKGRDKSFDVLINSFEDSVKEAYTHCLTNPNEDSDLNNPNNVKFCINHELPDYDVPVTITLRELLADDFIEPVMNPWKQSEACNPDSTVIVTRKPVEVKHKKSDGSIEILGYDDSIIDFEYKTCLICGDHSSDGC